VLVDAVLENDLSCDPVLETVDVDEAAEGLRFFVSSLGTYGPPASEHGTPWRLQFEHGLSSLHYELSDRAFIKNHEPRSQV